MFAMFGDMGNDNAVSLPYLQREVGEGVYDAIIHVGDMAYDMAELDGLRGDIFMEQIEPISSMIPYMTCPGLKEIKFIINLGSNHIKLYSNLHFLNPEIHKKIHDF